MDAYANWLLGCVLEDKGDLDGAGISLRRAIEIDPEDGDTHWGLRCVFEAKGDLGGSDLDLDELSDDEDNEYFDAEEGAGIAYLSAFSPGFEIRDLRSPLLN